MTKKHSPLPFSIDPDTREGMGWNIHILDAKDDRVCFMTSDGPNEANADLIVRSVNALPELVAALEEIAAAVPANQGGTQGAIRQRALSALSKVKDSHS